MKTILVVWILYFLTVSLSAQDGYDRIERDSFLIVKTSLDVKKDVRKPVSSFRTSTDVENHCGANYVVNRTYGEMTDAYYSQYRYPDGLILEIPENEGEMVGFTVTGDAFALLLSNGVQVRIGMKGPELARIFPDSYANRKPVSETRGKEGKISFIVHFAYTIDNQVHKEDAFIRFVLNQNTGALEEFHTYQPS